MFTNRDTKKADLFYEEMKVKIHSLAPELYYNTISNRILTQSEFDELKIYYSQESLEQILPADSSLIKKANINNLFRVGLFSLLSASEMYVKQKRVYDNLTTNYLDIPETILDIKNYQDLKLLVNDAIFPNKKEKVIFKFAEWWQENESSLPEILLEDIANGRKKEIILRDKFAEQTPGFGYKCASLFMTFCGYENIAVLDIWCLRFMKSKGYKVKDITHGLTKKDYLSYEEKFYDIAQKLNLTPAKLHRLIWVKNSTWKKTKK